MKKMVMDQRRVRALKAASIGDGPVLYIMSRDQRVNDNWALLYAQEMAIENSQPLIVIACPVADYPETSGRQINFSLTGIKQIENRLTRLRIPMMVLSQGQDKKLPMLVKNLKASAIVFDFSPLRESRRWKRVVADRVKIPVYEVDAHNIVPVWQASPKLEYGAYTLRPKLNRQLSEYLTDFSSMNKHPIPWSGDIAVIEWEKIEKSLKAKPDPALIQRFNPGDDMALKAMKSFLSRRLSGYNQGRNDPNAGAQSDLSPYLHSGQLSAQRVAFEAQRYDNHIASQEAFLEELIVRRELADNFCYYNENYDSFNGFPEWAQKTLDEHRHDIRPYIYDTNKLESGQTHDELWNAAQMEMVVTGKMHGYLRMYWAKKILEWSPSPEEALANAIYLNDKYELDGHDPNGYAGIAWSIGGVHDRAWSEREIFGKIRYMSLEGCRRKFSVTDYVKHIAALKTKVTV